MTIRRSLCKVCALTHTKEIERLHTSCRKLIAVRAADMNSYNQIVESA